MVFKMDSILTPELLGQIITAVATLIAGVMSISVYVVNSNITKKNIRHFFLSRENVKKILDLKELKNKDNTYQKQIKIILSTLTSIGGLIFFFTFHPLGLLVSIIVSGIFLLGSMMFLITGSSHSVKIMKIYKFYRLVVYANIFVGLFATSTVSFEDKWALYQTLSIFTFFVLQSILDFLNMSTDKELYYKEIDEKIRTNKEKLPLVHISLKYGEDKITGKMVGLNKKYLIVEEGKKDIMIAWKDIVIFSVDS